MKTGNECMGETEKREEEDGYEHKQDLEDWVGS